VALSFAAGGLGAVALWYAGLAKPVWTPAERLFGAAWTTMYMVMGVAAWIIWGERYHRGRSRAVFAFVVQLLVNALWTTLIFGTRNMGAGLLAIVALWLALAWTVREFWAVRAASAYLMLPYLACVTFAAALNLANWRHSP